MRERERKRKQESERERQQKNGGNLFLEHCANRFLAELLRLKI